MGYVKMFFLIFYHDTDTFVPIFFFDLSNATIRNLKIGFTNVKTERNNIMDIKKLYYVF